MNSDAPPPAILIDSREKLPFLFDGMASVRRRLAVGDYSLDGFTSQIAVERKSHIDAWNCTGSYRMRFERCLARLAAVERPALVIECTLQELAVAPPLFSRVTPATAVGSYISWAARYRIPVFFAGDRAYAERLVVRFLLSALKAINDGH